MPRRVTVCVRKGCEGVSPPPNDPFQRTVVLLGVNTGLKRELDE